ncbi:DUF2520 domain-containing protein [Segetibacter sp. 3557_3]|uniref:Rossmann-like and DUF2520 domain-containing protein n=1 Tax=Segetibacter sp. 3557_3 TaxID=2547429 RepID=UPI0010585C93|nr:Rossmann-like and DUF2520 domain-containing protein [Segetibacter sp. 3557_3]TDH26532.1 DUF2520 domain-containing protein [Segetibacter sp. 3557_3]
MKVVIIGSGNVATVLGKVVCQGGHEIHQVVSRNRGEATRLAAELSTVAAEGVEEISREGEIYIIAVSDNQVAAVAKQLGLLNKIVVHTAGSVAMDVLQQTGDNFGVVYPLQSLRKDVDRLPPIPVLVNGSNPHTIEVLTLFAGTWAAGVRVADDEERLKTHVAAVIASNFTNHLYALTERYCIAEALDFKSLVPLISEIAGRISQASPALLQTGPASRGDQATIEKHLQLLSGYPAIQTIYASMSQSITTHQHKLVNAVNAG